MPARVRLNKFLRDCNLGSRRKCERLIEQGLVEINDEVVTQIGTLVDLEKDVVKVGGIAVRPETDRIYVVAYKPRGAVVTLTDPHGRPTIFDVVKDLPQGIFPVGRLDKESEGLILLTNDGKLAHRLTHPRYGIERVYLVEVEGEVSQETIEKLMSGVVIDSGLARVKHAKMIDKRGEHSMLKITLTEGKKREIRQMLQVCGYSVVMLKRIRFGCVTIGDLSPGQCRYLTRDELRGLRRLVEEAYLAKKER